jgi:hypothetical protein
LRQFGFNSLYLQYSRVAAGGRAFYTIPAPAGEWQFGFASAITGFGEFTGNVEIDLDKSLDFVFENWGLIKNGKK